MRRARLFHVLSACVLLPFAAFGCGGDEKKNTGECKLSADNTSGGCDNGLECQQKVGGDNGEGICACSEANQTGCKDGQICETTVQGNSDCYDPITISGQVVDLASKAGIEGARVIAQTVNGTAASGIAITDANGNYTLAIPTPRNKDGTPSGTNNVTLRADAAGYLTFPLPPRIALPIDTAKAMPGTPLTNDATTIGLIAIPNTDVGTVSGKVVDTNSPWGTLVVAGGSQTMGGGVTGIADRDGSYTVFNVPAGTQTVSGYKVGLQITPTTAMVTAGQETKGVDLHAAGEAKTVVSGSVDMVDPGMGSTTSVILVVQETFDPNAARGQTPPGLRVGNITNNFTFTGVPDGHYVVLAAFENDYLVRDPDTSIAGTDIVKITVPGSNDPISQAFKITGSLDNPSPDNEQVVMGTPSFTWKDDSGEDHYEIRVFDAFGNNVWEDLNVPGAMGKDPVVQYGGPALTSGMLYQFRATSIKLSGAPLSTTEDLRGTFIYQ